MPSQCFYSDSSRIFLLLCLVKVMNMTKPTFSNCNPGFLSLTSFIHSGHGCPSNNCRVCVCVCVYHVAYRNQKVWGNEITIFMEQKTDPKTNEMRGGEKLKRLGEFSIFIGGRIFVFCPLAANEANGGALVATAVVVVAAVAVTVVSRSFMWMCLLVHNRTLLGQSDPETS